jgi:hypothetical protein
MEFHLKTMLLGFFHGYMQYDILFMLCLFVDL